jgi:spoIIIJ-associated protein
MIKTLEKAGRTEDDAIKAALEELGLSRDDVSVEIVVRPKSGFFGFGAVHAVVRVSYDDGEPENSKPKTVVQKETVKKAEPVKKESPVSKPSTLVKKDEPSASTVSAVTDENPVNSDIRSFLSGLFEKMDIEAEMVFSNRDNSSIDVSLSGNGMGAIIGRRGETLDAIQHLTNYVVNRGRDKRLHINIDAEAYRSKREESLTHLAEKMAEKAIKYKRNMALEPMNSYERHVIHTSLQNYKGVSTASTGEEPNRRVIVIYEKTEDDSDSSRKPKVREWA